jgi:predicted nicotinamide N-methyase
MKQTNKKVGCERVNVYMSFTSLLVVLALADGAACHRALRPKASPLRSFSVGGRSVKLHIPTDDEILESVMAQAHAAALDAGEGNYDRVMEDFVSENIGPAYWAQVWPSSLALGARLLAQPSLASDASSILELGCGLGLASICAALAGAQSVLATDIETSALDFTDANAAANGVADGVVRVQQLDWADIAEASPSSPPPQQHELLLAADIVYGEEAPALLAEVLHALVAPGGTVLLTDNRDRPYADRRRESLLRRLCAPTGDFSLESMSEERVELLSRQGDEFAIAHIELRRRPRGGGKG